jgi:hypothetical protein
MIETAFRPFEEIGEMTTTLRAILVKSDPALASAG